MESPSVASINGVTVDVLIPTMGREKYLFDVLKDLSVQSHLPKKVIIVEQNPSVNSSSQLDYVDGNTWPFEIKHLFINRTGACNARNLGLEQVTSDWVFLADDDIRFDVPLIEDSIAFAKANHVKALTVSCLPMGQEEKLLQPIQWNAFGSGCSFVAGSALENLRFDLALEHGYGEDADFGNRLRDSGVDILYHPDIRIKHLKAPMGGFRATVLQPWEKDMPKPSPTVMISILRHYTREQLAGYKLKLWIKFYVRQEVKNPFTYIKMMRSRWAASQQWAQSLLSSSYEN
jgi:glycosyltransferase involved in cell wall biosynthesis